MSRRTRPRPGILVFSVIFRREDAFAEALDGLARDIGPVREVGAASRFDWTGYYDREMGPSLFRRFVVLSGTWPRDALAGAKIRAEAIEERLAGEGRRTVNIDPGILTEESFILATGKNFSHRVYLGDGVFADLTLIFRRGAYEPLPWTYPDYASGPVREYLLAVRGMLRGEHGQKGET